MTPHLFLSFTELLQMPCVHYLNRTHIVNEQRARLNGWYRFRLARSCPASHVEQDIALVVFKSFLGQQGHISACGRAEKILSCEQVQSLTTSSADK